MSSVNPGLPAVYATIKRPLDWFYIVFFIFHTFTAVFIDGQHFLPTLIPQALRDVKEQYLRDSADPLMSRLGSPEVAWFEAAIILELVLQTPVFIHGAHQLIKDNARVYPILAVYGGLASSSTLFSLVQALQAPSLTQANRAYIVQAYGPFTVIPVIIMVDMVVRCTALIEFARVKVAKGGKAS